MKSLLSSLLILSLLHLALISSAQGVAEYASLMAMNKILPSKSSLSLTHYAKTCPSLESIVYRKVNAWVQKDYTLAASLIRLHFHDCAVRGCDGSILLNGKASERTAKASKTLRGFQVIDDIKAEVEKSCPKTVSCADILTTAARDATFKIGGPFWEVPFGRKDGTISVGREADMVPVGRENITSLIHFFQARGLSLIDLVALSGSHTIGRSTCGAIQDRLYNFNETGKPDPAINTKYLKFLKSKCRGASGYADLDATTPKVFDAAYYTNLEKKMGLFSTDQLLFSDPRTAPFVSALASVPMLFEQQFAVSMVNLANTQVLTGKAGEIRVNCNYRNIKP